MLTLIKHKDSHTDHGLTDAQLGYVLGVFSNFERKPIAGIEPPAVMVQTITLPEWLGTAPCALRGPNVGDIAYPDFAPHAAPEEADNTIVITMRKRGNRPYCSRTIDLPCKPTRLVTVIAGPHDGHELVLYTAHGGPPAPREVGELLLELEKYPAAPLDVECSTPKDATTKRETLQRELAQSRDFWATHALSFDAEHRFTWHIALSVSRSLVGDGFDLDAKHISELMRAKLLPFAYPHEATATLMHSPDPEAVAVAQGYANLAAKVAADLARKL